MASIPPFVWRQLRRLITGNKLVIVLAFVVTTPVWGSTPGSLYARLHTYTMAELEQELASSPPAAQTAVRLAIARSTGRGRLKEGLRQLAKFDETELSTNEHAYYLALQCGMFLRDGHLDRAEGFYDSLLELGDLSVLNPSVRAQVYDSIGSFATRRGRIDEALAAFDKGLEAAVMANDKEMLAVLHHNRSVPLTDLRMTDLAIRSLETSRRYLDAVPDDSQLRLLLLYNLGYIQAQRGDYSAAIVQFEDAIVWLAQMGQNARVFMVTTQLAHAFTATGRHQEAIDRLGPWLDRTDQTFTPDSRADAYLAMAEAYQALGEFERADQMINLGLAQARSISNPVRVRQLLLSRATLALEQNEPTDALRVLNGLISQAPADTGFQASVFELMAKTQAELGNYQMAWDYESQFKALDMQTRSENFDVRLSALRAAAEVDIIDYQLAVARAQEQAAQLQSSADRVIRNATIVGAVFAALIFFLLFRRIIEAREARVQRQLKEALEEKVTERTEQVTSEMQRRVEAEQANSALRARVAEDERLRTMGQLTGGVAHDFNNLLTVIILSAEMLKKTAEQAQIGALEDIVNAGESGRAITQSLLSYARQQDLQAEAMRLDEFISENVSMFRRTLGEGIQLNLELLPATIVADRGLLTTCLINLLFNARDALAGNGEVSLNIELHDEKLVNLLVIDNGPGMHHNVLGRATEPFFTTKTDGKGSGLGLSMAYGFMKQSEGDLYISSELDAGTTVCLSFPMVTADVVSVSLDSPRNINPPGTATALIIEDQAPVRLVCKAALERMGFHVVEAENGQLGLEYIAAEHPLDLVVSDAVMPGGVSGIDVAETVANTFPNLPVILMSGGVIEVPDNCVFMSKPFTLVEFQQTIEQMMGKAELSA